MTTTKKDKCNTCGKKAHDFEKEEIMDCVPPVDVLKFGKYEIDKEYRQALYSLYPFYTAEEVVGSYLGNNPNFRGQDSWFEQQKRDSNIEE
ncbi:hypothetical protein H9Q08_17555 [Chryseobacterium sp. PS-8]|uniref:Uncharacterized protein n=1 Tax=Chryseobacterium indicum TaxID=2766954 RepID=A0ABS9C9I8_9FLAO|nr:hypothetical protein [Chryseobacterium sp. PS-8]MCF2221096.1 hypothetical protein [Chryseobacterium sp. PS-8]